jgi:hypothetical protein
MVAAEGGSYDTFREWARATARSATLIIQSAQPSRHRQRASEQQYTATLLPLRMSAGRRRSIANRSLFTYSLSDTGNPNTIFDPRP